MKKNIKILSISGSLRQNSSTHAIIHAVSEMIPAQVDFLIYNGLAALPAFNDSNEHPLSVMQLRRQLNDADGILICTPEYAFGVPGSLKNALDWTVGTGELNLKPVGVITAATGGEYAHASLMLTLKALGSKITDGGTAIISHVRSKINANGIVSDHHTIKTIQSVVDALIANIKEHAAIAMQV